MASPFAVWIPQMLQPFHSVSVFTTPAAFPHCTVCTTRLVPYAHLVKSASFLPLAPCTALHSSSTSCSSAAMRSKSVAAGQPDRERRVCVRKGGGRQSAQRGGGRGRGGGKA